MSLVRYTNKKTGRVTIYESTSCYDPIKKTSRPKRKYLGYEDPITKEFIPSSGKPGRKKKSEGGTQGSSGAYYEQYKRALAELQKQREENEKLTDHVRSLTNQNRALQKAVEQFSRAVKEIIQDGE